MSRRGGHARRGAALFIVLLFSALLAGLAAVAFRATLSGARAAAAFLDVMRADELGRSAADILAYRIGTGDPEVRRGGAITIRLPEAEIAIDYRSESARIDVNTAPIPLIAALLVAADASPGLVSAVALRITQLRGPPGGANAEGGPPAGQTPPATAAPAPDAAPTVPQIQDTSEVVRLWGLPKALAGRILASLTTANGSATVDPILADRPVLAALLGGDGIRVDDYIARRAQGFANSDAALDPLPVPARPFAGFTDVPVVRALVRVTIAHRLIRRYDLVLDPPGGTGPALKVLSWQARF